MKHFKHLLLVLFALVTFSCGKSEPEKTEPTPTPKPTDKIELAAGTDLNPVISTDGGTLSVTFNASTAWSAQAVNDRADGWCSVSPTSGNAGSGTITITAKANTEPDERSASINIKAGTATQTIKVTQKQKDALTVTASTFEVPAEGKDINIEVKANVNVPYKIDQQCSDWIKYVSTKALKTSTLTFAVSKNENVEKREGKIIIGEGALSDTIKIFQAGEAPSIVLNKDEYIAKSEGETFAIEVASNVDVNINILHPDGSPTWLQEHKTKTMSTNTYYFTAATNEEYDNREARIVFANKENNLSDTVKVIQLQKDAIVLAKNIYEIDNKGGNISIEVAHNVDYKVAIGADWITQVETKGLETDYLTFEIAENKEYDNRDAIITFSSADGSITQEVKVCQSQADAVIISKKEYILNSTGGDVTIEVRSNVDFTVENPNCDWIDEVKTKGLTTHTLNYKVAENTGYDSRTASIIIINSKTGEKDSVVISQLQKDAIVLAKNEYEFGVDGGNLDLKISTNININDIIVEIEDDAKSWLSQINTKGLDSVSLLFSIATCEPGVDRTGTITLKGRCHSLNPIYIQTIKIRQGWRKEVLDLQRKVLINIYNATNGKNWKNANNWCSDKPIWEWQGVQLNKEGFVERLSLRHKKIEGKLPECIGSLTSLKYLDAYDNNITGPLPDSISNCNELIYLELGNNPLTGAVIPESWGKLEKLEELYISGTNLSGNIPKTIGGMRNLKHLELEFNQITGTIPESFGNLSELEVLKIGDNQLAGSIPESFYKLKNLKDLNMVYNNFNGRIPESFQNTEIWKNYWPNVLDGNSFDVSNVRLYGPSFSNVKTVNGKIISDEIYKQNKITVLCGWLDFPSERTLSSLKKTYDNHKDRGLRIICYTNESDENKIRDFMIKNDIEWDVFSLTNNKEAFLLRNSVYPLTNIIDETGEIVHTDRIDMPNNLIHKFVYMYFYDGYESTDYSKDGEVHILQRATKGKGIDIILMGDAFADRDVNNGTYHKVMETAMEKFFAVEPYRSFRDHFNFYYVTVISKHGVYGETYAPKFEMYSETALDCFMDAGSSLCGGNDDKVVEYALKIGNESSIIDGTIIVIMNSPEYKGTCYVYNPIISGSDWGEGLTISYFPIGEDDIALEQVLNHEANGHGFAKLADEYAYEYMGTIPLEEVTTTQTQQKEWGWWKNVDFTDDLSLIKWTKFISDARYQYEGLGAFEGGLTYWSGVWRPTDNSIMRYNYGGFNAPSREAIYYRIHKLAYGPDWEYDYEKFVEYDAINRKTSSRSQSPQILPLQPKEPLHPPVIVNKTLEEVLNRN